MVKKTFQAFKSLNFEVRPRSQSEITILSENEKGIDAKNWAARNSTSEITSPLEMVKKTCQPFESLNSDVRDRSQAEITMLDQDDHVTDTKNRTLTNSDSERTNPLEMVKKPIQVFESLNSDIRVRCQTQITILGQDEHKTDAKDRTSTNLASQLTNPFEMVKKNISGF